MQDNEGADASLEPEVDAIEPDGEVEETEVTESEAESPPAEETEQKPDPFQERIDKLTRRFRDTERDLQAAARERDELKRKLEEMPRAEPEKSLEDFNYDESKYRQYLFQEAERRAEAKADSVVKQHLGNVGKEANRDRYFTLEKDFAKSVDDFYEVTMSESLQVSEAMADEIEQSEIGPELIYHLGKNPDEAMRISRLSERAAIREMVLLENKLRTEKAKPAKRVSNAPPPAKKISGTEPGLKVSPTDPKSDELSDEDWFKAEAARQAKLRK